jgi:hypothetical protein
LGEDLENTHGIPAAHWQLQTAVEGRLKAIVLPLLEEPVWDKDIECWVLSISGLGKIAWNYKFPDHVENFPWQVGDRIFLQEEWDYFLDKLEGELCCPLKRTSPMYPYGWQPAEAMPPEAAQYWYEVKKVRVMQAKDVAILSTSFSSGHSSPILILEEWTKYWNAAYPEQVWDGDLWGIMLDVEAIAP